MAPFYAFTSLDGVEFALVCQGKQDEIWSRLKQRAAEKIDEIAAGVSVVYLNKLQSNLRVVMYATVLQEPYQAYLKTPFDLGWLQAQADAVRLRRAEA